MNREAIVGALSNVNWRTVNVVAGRVGTVVLLVLCLYYVAMSFWRVFYPESFSLGAPTLSDAEAPKVADARGRWDWFTDTSVAPTQVAPPSRLDASLIGVIARGNESGKGLALIKYKGKEKIYRVDDELASGVTMKEVGDTYVILQRDDKTERLEIEKAASLIGGKPAADKSKSRRRETPKIPDEPSVVSSAKEFKTILRKEPLQLLNLFSFEQVESGKQTGFSLSAKREDGKYMLDSLGLKEGDVLLSVNGAPASQMPANPKLWKAMLKADKIKLKLLRNGAKTEISIN